MRIHTRLGLVVVALTLGATGGVATAAVPTLSPVTRFSPGVHPRTQASTPSCQSATSCLLLGNSDRLLRYDRGRLGLAGSAPRTATALSCPTSGFCMFVGGNQGSETHPLRGWTRSGGHLRAHTMPQPPAKLPGTVHRPAQYFWSLESLSCGSPTRCVAVGSGYAFGDDGAHHPQVLVERWDGNRWHRDRLSDPVGELDSISCPTAGMCMAVGSTDDSERRYIAAPELYRDGRWTPEPLPAIAGEKGVEVAGVSCTSVTRCVAVGDAGPKSEVVAAWNGSQWSDQLVDAPAGARWAALEEVSCPPGPRTTCTATGDYGSDNRALVAQVTSGLSVTQTEQPAVKNPESDVPLDCPTTGFCLASGGHAAYRTPAGWTSAVRTPAGIA